MQIAAGLFLTGKGLTGRRSTPAFVIKILFFLYALLPGNAGPFSPLFTSVFNTLQELAFPLQLT